MTGRPSLRDELSGGATPTPPYALMLPSGWREFAASADAERELTGLVANRLRGEHRPDLLARYRAMSGRAFAGMRGAGVERVYLQTEAWGDGLVAPMSITVAVRVGPEGGSLDGIVADLVRRGATALRGDQRFIRHVQDAETALGGQTVRQRTISYLTPFPDRRTHALQFTTVLLLPEPDDDGAKPLERGFEELSDAIVSTFAWRPE
ncbi:hypothetical protein [Agromyces seonyuensis]|uniref:Uncharacterized protein n=1 Tax=Agromyces seonyuensis TaxID=2662446 RepID=A0A6I4NVS7_9MICO|nr:hypothetical protein [Agromyces seonyuensis]MWB98201.1 hypothetical protein [Agromyces seonyuensis]